LNKLNILSNRPITESEFAGLMALVGPFEARPTLAVAVSGGADSMALALMAHQWSGSRGGGCVGLTVDHGLRLESSHEAIKVGNWLDKYGISQHVLKCNPPTHIYQTQKASREVRYKLLTEWCHQQGVLHLLLAHHMNDLAETLLMRLCKGSGVEGLAGMSSINEMRNVRLLRPFLKINKKRLRVSLKNWQQEWIEDSSNQDMRFTRSRFREVLESEGLDINRFSKTASKMAHVRVLLEIQVNRSLANIVSLHPAGYGVINGEKLQQVPAQIGQRILSRILMCIGGGFYPPRGERIKTLWETIRNKRTISGYTCAGCFITHRAGKLIVIRELGAIKDKAYIKEKTSIFRWDRRFQIDKNKIIEQKKASPLVIKRLDNKGWRGIVAEDPRLREVAIPSLVRPTLPAFWQEERVIAVPHLGVYNCDYIDKESVRFSPPCFLCPTIFTIA
jgi:tRNA(Ile)-lysidine synthase